MHTSNLPAILSLLVFIGAYLVVATLGTIGFSRDVHALLMRRKLKPTVIAGLTVFAAVLGFSMVWLFYVIWWPFKTLFGHTPKLKRLAIVGPIICVVALLIGAGIFAFQHSTYPTFVNDTQQSIEITGCTLDPATLKPGERAPNIPIGKGDKTCSVVQGAESYGCLLLPSHVDSHTVIRLSTYTPLAEMKGSCE